MQLLKFYLLLFLNLLTNLNLVLVQNLWIDQFHVFYQLKIPNLQYFYHLKKQSSISIFLQKFNALLSLLVFK